MLSLTLAAPNLELAQVFVRHAQGQDALLYAGRGCDPLGEVVFGTAIGWTAPGLSEVEAPLGQASALLNNWLRLGWNAPALAPRCWLGAAFPTTQRSDPAWSDFASLELSLPRWRYCASSEQATLTLTLRSEELTAPRDVVTWATQFEQQLRTLRELATEASQLRSLASQTLSCPRSEQPPREQWQALVSAATATMSQGELQKVVLARAVELTFDEAPALESVLARLGELYPDTTLFAVRRGQSTFLGATPERLLSLRGREMTTEALAGSVRAEDKDAERHLLASDKDRREHALVVEAIVTRCRELGARVEFSTFPGFRHLRNVIHLHTPITARFGRRQHAVRLAAELHPTPAVGGAPAALAQDYLDAHEALCRGWYAGSLGWFDAEGDGDFVVTLRSGLFQGNRARLFGGAGVLRDSSPGAEWDETEQKLRGLGEALGLLATSVAPPPCDVEPPLRNDVERITL